MTALVSISECTLAWLMVVVPTAIAFLRFRARRRVTGEVFGEKLFWASCGTLLFSAVFLFVLVADWRATRPGRLMARFLHVQDLAGFEDLRSDFVGGLDYTAWLYFRTSKSRLMELVRVHDFQLLPAGQWHQGYMAAFSRAPDLPPEREAVAYYRVSPTEHDIQYLITDAAHEQVWFVSMDN